MYNLKKKHKGKWGNSIYINKKRFWFSGDWLLSSCLILSMTSCESGFLTRPNSVKRLEPTQNTSNKSTYVDGLKSIYYRGVSFSYDSSFDTLVKPRLTKESSLEKEDDKPCAIFPSHILFRFEGKYGDQHKGSFFPAEMHIYPINEYRKQLGVSKDELARFDQSLSGLRGIILEKNTAILKNIPLVDFIDAGQAFHAKMEFSDFSDGTGIWFLTQYSFEPSLINNKGLTYVFQGLSNDGKYYVLATFPVSLTFLPASNEARKFGNYELPERFAANDEKEFNRYVSKIKIRLEELPSRDFNPSLENFKRIISTLKIADTKTKGKKL